MHLGATSASPYRVPEGIARDREAAPHAEPSVVGVLLVVLGGSLLRVALFVIGSEGPSVDPMLAIAASVAAVSCIASLRATQGWHPTNSPLGSRKSPPGKRWGPTG